MIRAKTDPMETAGPLAPHGATGTQCSARAKATGERCRRAAIRGGSVCPVHGGRAPQVVAAARRRREAAEVEEEVRDLLAFTSFDGVRDPLEALARLADESLAFKEALGAKVNALGGQIRYKASGTGTEQVRGEVVAYERSMDRAYKILDSLAKSGFEERRTRLSELQATQLVGVLQRIFNRLDLTPEQRALIPTVVPQELRSLSSSTVRGEVLP